MISAPHPPAAPLCEVGLSPHPHSQPFCLFQHLLHASGSSGMLAYHPALALILLASPDLAWCYWLLWEVGLLQHPYSQSLLLYSCSFTKILVPGPTPILWGRFSVPHPPLLLVLDYSSLFTLFSCVVGGFSLPRDYVKFCSQGWVRVVVHGM
jgi:hypothetical protein